MLSFHLLLLLATVAEGATTSTFGMGISAAHVELRVKPAIDTRP
jgi:hypothetical protein